MEKPGKRKLCWNCEGNVSRVAEHCPYCGVYLSPEMVEEEESSSTFTPPYQPPEVTEQAPLQAPYQPVTEVISTEPIAEAVPLGKGVARAVFFSIFCLGAGTLSILFALLLFFFSSHGVLTLQWEEGYWVIFALFAVPLLFLGWKSLPQEE